MHKTLEMLKEYFVRLVRNDLQMINLKLSNDQIKKFDFQKFIHKALNATKVFIKLLENRKRLLGGNSKPMQ